MGTETGWAFEICGRYQGLVIFNNGDFMLRWYSLIVVRAIITGVWFVAREAEHKGFKSVDYQIVLISLESWIQFLEEENARLQETLHIFLEICCYAE